MVDLSSFPTCGELSARADQKLWDLLDPLPRPLTWVAVKAALREEKWWAHATFDNPGYMSSEVGDYIIRLPESTMGYRTYEGGIEPREGYYVHPDEVA